MRRALALLWLLAGCTSGSFAAIDQVTGLTVLAIQAQPPDQLVIDDGGGVFGLGCSPASGTCPPGGLGPADAGPTIGPVRPITLSALVADPAGGGRGIQVVFATCAALDATTHQCLAESPDYELLGSGAYFPDAGPSVVATATFTPDEQLLVDALALDPLHGAGYLPLRVQVTASAGSEQVVAVKTITLSQPIALPTDAGFVIQPPDGNPVNPSVNLDGSPWLSPQFSPTPVIATTANIQPTLGVGGLGYLVRELDGGLLPFTDYDGYEFYCTAGSFSSPRSGGGPRPGFTFGLGRKDAGAPVYDDAGETVPSTQVQWNADAGQPDQLVYFWIVVVDGRGGVSFGERTAQYQAP
ncbi:MAG TPA: hypothetical protein VMB50_16930 [Myxococcales bacterium]|nr:hypothetical protein [Myxococcales bacterium]